MDRKWMNDPALTDIDVSKLEQLSSLAEQGNSLNQKELLPFLLAAASKSKKQKINFSSVETQAILSVLKKNKTPEEQKKMDQMIHMLQQMQNRSHH